MTVALTAVFVVSTNKVSAATYDTDTVSDDVALTAFTAAVPYTCFILRPLRMVLYS